MGCTFNALSLLGVVDRRAAYECEPPPSPHASCQQAAGPTYQVFIMFLLLARPWRRAILVAISHGRGNQLLSLVLVEYHFDQSHLRRSSICEYMRFRLAIFLSEHEICACITHSSKRFQSLGRAVYNHFHSINSSSYALYRPP